MYQQQQQRLGVPSNGYHPGIAHINHGGGYAINGIASNVNGVWPGQSPQNGAQVQHTIPPQHVQQQQQHIQQQQQHIQQQQQRVQQQQQHPVANDLPWQPGEGTDAEKLDNFSRALEKIRNNRKSKFGDASSSKPAEGGDKSSAAAAASSDSLERAREKLRRRTHPEQQQQQHQNASSATNNGANFDAALKKLQVFTKLALQNEDTDATERMTKAREKLHRISSSAGDAGRSQDDAREGNIKPSVSSNQSWQSQVEENSQLRTLPQSKSPSHSKQSDSQPQKKPKFHLMVPKPAAALPRPMPSSESSPAPSSSLPSRPIPVISTPVPVPMPSRHPASPSAVNQTLVDVRTPTQSQTPPTQHLMVPRRFTVPPPTIKPFPHQGNSVRLSAPPPPMSRPPPSLPTPTASSSSTTSCAYPRTLTVIKPAAKSEIKFKSNPVPAKNNVVALSPNQGVTIAKTSPVATSPSSAPHKSPATKDAQPSSASISKSVPPVSPLESSPLFSSSSALKTTAIPEENVSCLKFNGRIPKKKKSVEDTAKTPKKEDTVKPEIDADRLSLDSLSSNGDNEEEEEEGEIVATPTYTKTRAEEKVSPRRSGRTVKPVQENRPSPENKVKTKRKCASKTTGPKAKKARSERHTIKGTAAEAAAASGDAAAAAAALAAFEEADDSSEEEEAIEEDPQLPPD